MSRECKARGCGKPITDKTRSAYCKACRGPSTHGIKPTIRFFAAAVS